MPNYARVLLCFLFLSITSVVFAQTEPAFVGDLEVDATGHVPSVQVSGTVGDKIWISYAAPGPPTADCRRGGFSALKVLKLTANGDPVKLASATQTIPLSTIYVGAEVNPLVAGVQVCIRAERVVGGQTLSQYSDAPKTVSSAPAVAALKISPPPVSGDSVLGVQPSIPPADLPMDLFVFSLPISPAGGAMPDCNTADLATAIPLKLGMDAETSQEVTDNTPITLVLNKQLSAGDLVCLVGVYRHTVAAAAGVPPVDAGDKQFASIARVAPAPTGQISFLSDLVGGLSTVNFVSSATGSVSIYLFGAGYSHGVDSPCRLADRQYGALLNAVGNGTNATISSMHVDANVPQVVSLTQPLLAGSQVCIYESTSDSNAPSLFSKFKPVNYFAPGEDYGRFSLGFVGGAVISNQEQSSNSSTASQYLEVAFNYAIMRGIFKMDQGCPPYRTKCGRHGGPGLQAFMDVRSSTIPVTSIDNQSQAHASGTVDITQSLNALSSQQSVRIVTGLYAPFRLTRWYRSTNWLTLGPLAVGGFDTLLNPTAPQAPPSTGSVINTTTSNFSSVYGYFAAGGEINWKVYAASTDEAPRDMGWVSATLGHYSNLPSYICTADSKRAPSAKSYFFNDAANPPTDCLVNTIVTKDANEVVTSTSYNVFASRKLIPRLDIAGQLALPTLPVVLGMDANLGQYLIGGNKHEHLDTLNKAGNDVRIFIGIRLDPGQLLSKIGISTGSGK